MRLRQLLRRRDLRQGHLRRLRAVRQEHVANRGSSGPGAGVAAAGLRVRKHARIQLWPHVLMVTGGGVDGHEKEQEEGKKKKLVRVELASLSRSAFILPPSFHKPAQ